jgi:hypothetical protein
MTIIAQARILLRPRRAGRRPIDWAGHRAGSSWPMHGPGSIAALHAEPPEGRRASLDATIRAALPDLRGACLGVPPEDLAFTKNASEGLKQVASALRLKAGANHQNNRLAAKQARTDGYDDALILTRESKLAEATGAAVLIVRDGELITPPVTSGLLESLARNFIPPLQDRRGNRPPVQREVERTALCIADEIFVCGTAEELTPVVSVDRIAIGDGKPGPMIRQFQRWLRDAARGRDPQWRDQIVPVR